MLLFHEVFNGMPVASVQATHKIGQVIAPIVDPRDLSISALAVQTPQRSDLVLFTSDIRSISANGLIIDHDEQLMEQEGLVRLEEVKKLAFEPLGKRVETEDGNKLGSVGRWAFDTVSWKVMKLHVTPSVTKSVSSSGFIIDRQQVVKVTDHRIIVKSSAIKVGGSFSWRKLFLGSAKPSLEPDTTKTK
jgi:uncharacterized protein YrrD